MKHLLAVSVGVGLLLVASSGLPRANPPAPAAPQTGRVLILEDGRTLTGDIERDGDRFRIRRLTGETSVQALPGMRLCGTLDEALAYLRSRANLNDPDERMRLADWCRQHRLLPQATAEVEAALVLRPEDPRIRRMLRALQDSQKRAAAPTVPAPSGPSMPRVDVTAETLNVFATKVQPILMNACASCHNSSRGGAFALRHVSGIGVGDRRPLDHNLSLAVSMINPREPLRSKLLTKAVTVHGDGMTAPPLRGKQLVAAGTLEKWVLQLVASNPHLAVPPTAPTAPPSASVAATPPPPGTSSFGEARPPMAPSGSKEPEDPLSPDEFNRESYPKGPPTPQK